jgi:hypothetical protein
MPQTFQAIPLDEHTKWILGQPSFACIAIARILKLNGQDIPPKAEAEQAAVIHWMLNLYLEHGENWRQAGEAEIKRIKTATGG